MSFPGKIENLAETQILNDFFIFVANGHHFQKCQFLKVSIFGGVVFFFLVKNNIFMQKSSVFGQMSEFPSPVIK